MEFTNDIRFNRKPKNNKLLRITYSGSLYKSNSDEVYIVYGFGENWENTSEQKMIRTSYGFVYNIMMENYNTFNFCFRNNQNNWDNNNSFDYIAPIELSNTDGVINTVSEEESQKIVADMLDKLVNSAPIDIDNDENVKTVEVNSDSELLDTLVQELFEEYGEKTISNGNNVENIEEINEAEFDNYFNDLAEIQERPDSEAYKQVTELFDNLIGELEEKQTAAVNQIETNSESKNIFNEVSVSANEPVVETITEVDTELNRIFEEIFSSNTETVTEAITEVDIGLELNKIFEETFSSNTETVVESAESYTPTPDNNITFELDDDIFDYNNKEIDFSGLTKVPDSAEENQNVFDFNNKDFDFSNALEKTTSEIESIPQETAYSHLINTNKFSDSFYDDEDVSVHQFKNIVDNTVNELNSELSADAIASNNEEFKKQSEEFDKAVSEYAEYFDNLIEEIISYPTSTIASTVSNEEVFENEQTDIAVSESEENIQPITSDENSEYALLDYDNQGMFENIARKVKTICKTLFAKIPKLFGREHDTNE